MITPRKLIALFALAACSAIIVAGCGGPSEDLTDSQARQEAQMETENPDLKKSTEDESGDMAKKSPAGSETSQGGKPSAAAKLTADQLASAKSLFSQTCGGCHMLSAAGTNGAVGPNLDTTKFTLDQIKTQIANGKGMMPGGLLQGEDADLVASYVAESAAG